MRNVAYVESVQSVPQGNGKRWELYKVLSEPVRLRLLALAGEEELAIGELAELLGEGQPNISRHLKPLRRAGLLAERKEGRRVFVRLADQVAVDPVVADALASGRKLCHDEGAFARVAMVVRNRDAAAREFFDAPREAHDIGFARELPAYLSALAPLIERRRLAVDVGTGDGALLDVLAPVFDEVIAIDRAQAQLTLAAQRLESRGYRNVTLMRAELDADEVFDTVHARGNADVIFVSRVLHHAPRPSHALTQLSRLLAPGGAVVVIDYHAHSDERMREQQADTWLGFEGQELLRFAADAGLVSATSTTIPANRCGDGPDGHLDWQVLVARRPS